MLKPASVQYSRTDGSTKLVEKSVAQHRPNSATALNGEGANDLI